MTGQRARAGTKATNDRHGSIGTVLRLSELLTGLDQIELSATGMVDAYYDELTAVIGAREVGALLAAGRHLELPPHIPVCASDICA